MLRLARTLNRVTFPKPPLQIKHRGARCLDLKKIRRPLAVRRASFSADPPHAHALLFKSQRLSGLIAAVQRSLAA